MRRMNLRVRIGTVVAAAALLPFAFPPFGWYPLILPSLAGLLVATKGATSRAAFYLGMLYGILGYGGALYWLFHLFGAPALSLFAIFGLFTGLFCLSFDFLGKRLSSPLLQALTAATLWTGIEFYRSELFFLRFPWITPGSALGPTFLSPLVGVYGASFLVVAASAAFLRRKTLAAAVVLSSAVVLLGVFRPARIEADPESGTRVGLVQNEDCMLASYVLLTRTMKEDRPRLIVWPEFALPYDVRENRVDFRVLTNLCAEMDAVLVLGTKTVVGPGRRDWYNTALVLDRGGVLGEYYKTRPVHFFNDGIPGRSFDPIPTRLGCIGTPVCFDCDYTEVVRRMAESGAEFFAVPSFDARSWSRTQHLQHAALFRLRAAETGRWLVCAASSGVSQVVDPHGNVHGALPAMEEGVLTCRIDGRTRRTVFTRAGWIFPWLALAASVVLLGGCGLRRIIAGRRGAS